jgi:exonuclease SbcD
LFYQIPTKLPSDFRVLHTADWHLGKTLGDLSRHEEHRRFLAFLVDAVRNHDVDAVVVSGDVFDSAYPPQSALTLYYDFVSEFRRRTKASLVVTAGNHDSPAVLEAPRKLLTALDIHVVGHLPKKVKDLVIPLPHAAAPQVVVVALPFLRERDLREGGIGQGADAIRRQLAEGIRRIHQQAAHQTLEWRRRGIPVLAMGHLAAGAGATCPEGEREIHVGGLGTVGEDAFPAEFDYVALGHLHRPHAVGEGHRIRYAGSPIPLSFGEAADVKELRVVDFGEGRMVGCHALRLDLERGLAQWRVRFDQLALHLREKQPPRTPLTPWVEVVVEGAPPGEPIFQRVHDLAQGRPYEVVRVLHHRPPSPARLTAGEWRPEDQASDLLASPDRVFACRLEEEPDLGDEDRTDLATVFRELLDLHEDRLRHAADPVPGPERPRPEAIPTLPGASPPPA